MPYPSKDAKEKASSSSGYDAARCQSKNSSSVKLLEKGIDILGPVEAPLFLLRGRYRYRLLLKGDKRQTLNAFTRQMIEKMPPPSNIRLIIDVDPYTFM